MAKFSEFGADQVYDAVETFKQNCLLKDGSIFFGQEALWSNATISELHSVFNKNPDVGSGSFLEKFKDQISGAGKMVIRLAAEILYIYFLFPSNVSGYRKREVIQEILSWASDNLSDEHAMLKVLDKGIGSGGYGYNTRRPFEIAFLIEFLLKWKAVEETDQKTLLESPWDFQELMDSVEDGSSKQLRHMMLHMLFPDAFDRIASGNHKYQIVQAFSDLVSDKSVILDKQILEIRKNLENLLPDKKIDFYWSPIEEAWWGGSEALSELGTPLELINYKRQIVLYGPPGTGKSYTADAIAKTIIRYAALRELGAGQYFQQQKMIEEAFSSNIHPLQLHPSYSYEDFIRGLHIGAGGKTEYRAGFFTRLCESVSNESSEVALPHVLILDEMNRTDLSRLLGEAFSLLEKRGISIPLPGSDTDGNPFSLMVPKNLFIIGTMNLIDQSIEQVDFALRRRFLWIRCPFSKEQFLAAAENIWNAKSKLVPWSQVESDFERMGASAEAMNLKIHQSEMLGEQYEIGHTYLFDVIEFLLQAMGPYPTRKSTFLWTRKGKAKWPVEQLWLLSVQPLLEQYVAGLDSTQQKNEIQQLKAIFLNN